MITILIYLLTRLFVPKKNYYFEGDELRYLTTAKNFYKLWNRSFYDTHPPLYSWLVRLFKSGVIVSFLCSIGLYFVAKELYTVLALNPLQKTIALTFLTFNYTLIYYSNRVFRYQLIALLGTLTIYLMVIHNWIAAGFSWGLLGLTCVFAGLRGFFIWACLGLNPAAFVIFGITFSSWFFDKIKVYIGHEYYPSGIDGKIERVKDFTLKQLISPLYFDWNYAYYGKKELKYVFPKNIGGVFGVYKPLGFLFPIMLFFTIKGALISPAWVSILVLCLLYPALLKRFLPRNSIIAIPLIGFLFAKGVPQVPVEWVFYASGCLLAGFLCFQRAFLLTKPKIKAKQVSAYLDSLPKNGVLVEGLIAYPIAYNTHKKIIVLPHDPDKEKAIYQVNLSIEKFSLHYAVFSELWKTEELAYPAIEYIKNFELINTIKENEDTYYVFALSAHKPK